MEETPGPDFVGIAIERGKAAVKDALWKGVAWLFLVTVAGLLLMMAAAFAFYGAALGVGEALGHRVWLGYLITGTAFLLLVFFALLIQRFRSKRKKKVLFRKTAESTDRLVGIFDPRPWIRDHPWQTTGLAALGGFAVGFRMEMPGAGASAAPTSEGAVGKPSFLDELIAAGLEILKNALTPILATEVAKRINQEE